MISSKLKIFLIPENKIMAVSLNSRIPRKKTPLNSKPIIPIYANDEEFMTSEIQPTKKDLADEHQIHETEVDPFDDDTLHYYVPFKPNKENSIISAFIVLRRMISNNSFI